MFNLSKLLGRIKNKKAYSDNNQSISLKDINKLTIASNSIENLNFNNDINNNSDINVKPNIDLADGQSCFAIAIAKRFNYRNKIKELAPAHLEVAKGFNYLSKNDLAEFPKMLSSKLMLMRHPFLIIRIGDKIYVIVITGQPDCYNVHCEAKNLLEKTAPIKIDEGLYLSSIFYEFQSKYLNQFCLIDINDEAYAKLRVYHGLTYKPETLALFNKRFNYLSDTNIKIYPINSFLNDGYTLISPLLLKAEGLLSEDDCISFYCNLYKKGIVKVDLEGYMLYLKHHGLLE